MSRRIYRVNEALREVISQAVETEIRDPRLGFVTVTAVRTAPDLRDARVFVSVLGPEEAREGSLAALQAAHGLLQARIAERLRMKRTPRLEFVYDDTTDRAMHLNRLLDREADDIAARTAMSGHGDVERVAEVLGSTAAATVGVHDDPDLDAVGAAAGVVDLITQSGGRARLRVRPGTELPRCAWFLEPSAVEVGPPEEGDVLIAVDTGSLERLALDLEGWTGTVVNIDHHPDNTLFGDAVLVRPGASSAAELVADVATRMGLTPSPAAAQGLYAGILFDTGGFRHASSGAATFRAAATLVAAGAEPQTTYREVFEDRSLADLRLWATAVGKAQPLADGRALLAVLTPADVAASGESSRTEGIVDDLRAVMGVEAAALVRPQLDGPGTRVSLRSTDVDVGALARDHGGGGHKLAAGFSDDDGPEEVATWLSTELEKLLSTASS